MSLQFHIGAKIVCVNDEYQRHPFWPETMQYPVLKQIYTIRDIIIERDFVTFLLEEIRNAKVQYGDDFWIEVSWYDWHFKPVRQTNIDVFTAMLDLTPEQIREFQRNDVPRWRKVFQEEEI